MTVLLFAPLYPPQSGGAAQYFKQVEQAIPDKHDVAILTTPHGGCAPENVRRSYPRSRVHVWQGVVDLLRVLRSHDVTLAHVHPHFPHWPFYKPILRLAKVPIVYDVRDHLYDSNRMKAGAGYLAANESIAGELDVSQSTVRISPVIVTEQAPYRLTFGERTVGFVGDLTRAKGAHLAIQATEDLNVTLHVAGTGALRSMVAKSECEYHGELRHLDALALIASVDCLVLPSKSEGRPRVILEALQHGTPVVASDAGDINLAGRGAIVKRDSDSIRVGLDEWIGKDIPEQDVGQNGQSIKHAIETVYETVLR